MSPQVLAVVVLLLLPLASRADAPACMFLYENAQYTEAVQACEQVLADPERSPEERGMARIYLAASLYVLGYSDRVQQQLEVLAREHPGMRVDPVRFLPELVALAEGIRERVEAEKLNAAEQAALRERQALEKERKAIHLRPEAFGLVEPLNHLWRLGAGVSFNRGLVEGGARVWLGGPPAFHVQGGLVPGRGGLRPFVGLRATLIPSEGGYGAGAVVGGRLALPAGFVALVDVGADYFILSDEAHQRFALTVHLGLGFDVRLPY
jgi:hypothetical protein